MSSAHATEPIPDRIGVHEQQPGRPVDAAGALDVRRDGLEQLPAGRDDRLVHGLDQLGARRLLPGQRPLAEQRPRRHRPRRRRPRGRDPKAAERRLRGGGRLREPEHSGTDDDRARRRSS